MEVANMVDVKLYSLLKIVETGSYTKAAEKLSLSQPAVSLHIRQLEENLGAKLFEHAHNRIHLTREGEIVVSYARRMIALKHNMEEALKNERDQIHSLRIGITHSAENSVILEALAAYVKGFDGMNLKIITSITSNLYSMLRNYELDFAFVEGKNSDPSLRFMMLDTDCLVLAVAPDHPLASKSMVTISQLKQERLILQLSNSNTRSLFAASLESQNLSVDDFNVTMELDSIGSIKDLVRRGFGVSVLAKSTCMCELKKGELKVLTIENLSMIRETSLVCLKNYEHPDFLYGIVKAYNEMQR